MPKVALLVSANLTNVTRLQPQDGADDENIGYYFQLECERCGWKTVREVIASINVRQSGGRGNENCNVSAKVCGGCDRKGFITLVPGHGSPLTDHQSQDVKLMVFDCNGLFPTDYTFNGGWLATTTLGTEIHVDLKYPGGYRSVIDGVEVAVTDLKAKFVPFRG